MSKDTGKFEYHSGPFHFKRTEFDKNLQSYWCPKCEDGNIIAGKYSGKDSGKDSGKHTGKNLKQSIEKYHNCNCKNCNCDHHKRSTFDKYMNVKWGCDDDCGKGASEVPLL